MDENMNVDLPGPLEELYGEFYSVGELEYFGFTSVGKNCQVSRKCSFYKISGFIGDNVRIDDFCILKGQILIGSHIHICAYCMISGVEAPVALRDFCVLAARCSVYSASNDHSADVLGAPMAPVECTKQFIAPVGIGKAVLVGAHCVILPGVVIGDGASIGAGCVVAANVREGEMLRNAKPFLADRNRSVSRIRELCMLAYENLT